jgi:hypothetical protein
MSLMIPASAPYSLKLDFGRTNKVDSGSRGVDLSKDPPQCGSKYPSVRGR